MPAYNTTISGFVAGDDLDVVRVISNIPSGQYVSKAWFTVKKRYFDTDAQAIFQKIITASSVANQGVISDDGASDTVAGVLFVLGASDTVLLKPSAEYVYDIQVITSAGKLYTPETGVIVALPGITAATS